VIFVGGVYSYGDIVQRMLNQPVCSTNDRMLVVPYVNSCRLMLLTEVRNCL